MIDLFPSSRILPEGFSYVDNFLSENEEQTLIDNIATLELHPMIFHGFEAKRHVASFGVDYNFEEKTLSKGQGIPSNFQWLISQVAKHTSIVKERFAEMLITKYPAASVINWHRDAPPFDVIVGISLASSCILRFRPQEKAQQIKSAIISLPVHPRSLYVISGHARNLWQHSIQPVKELRYSITLRTLRA